MLVVVSTLAAPQQAQAQALLYPSVWFFSLYGSYRAAARNVAVLVAALLGGVVLSPAAHSAGFAVLTVADYGGEIEMMIETTESVAGWPRCGTVSGAA